MIRKILPVVFIVLVASIFLFSCKPAEKAKPVDSASSAVKKMDDLIHNPSGASSAAPGHPDMAGMKMAPGMGKMEKAPLPVEIPEEVKNSVKKVRLNLKNKQGGAEQIIEAAIDQEAKLGDSGLTVKVLAYLPAFVMDGSRITSNGTEPKNPAAKATIMENGKEIHTGWLFANMPTVHAFEHPTWAVTLVDAVKENPAK